MVVDFGSLLALVLALLASLLVLVMQMGKIRELERDLKLVWALVSELELEKTSVKGKAKAKA